jgi:hypothetical protein
MAGPAPPFPSKKTDRRLDVVADQVVGVARRHGVFVAGGARRPKRNAGSLFFGVVLTERKTRFFSLPTICVAFFSCAPRARTSHTMSASAFSELGVAPELVQAAEDLGWR